MGNVGELVMSCSASKRIVVLAATAIVLALPGAVFAALPELINRVKPSIVAIGTFDRTRSPAFTLRGTGFAVADGNLIATNAHVIPESLNASGNETLVIRRPSGAGEGQQWVAKVVGNDKMHDLALLRIDGTPLPAIPLQSGPVMEGQDVIFMGFPIGTVLGLSVVTHRAIISAITPVAIPGASAQQLNEKVIKRIKSGTFDVYQLDGTAYPGNSGGPLLNGETGEVIGVINMVFVKGTKEAALSHPSGISFAIPVLYLKDLMRQ